MYQDAASLAGGWVGWPTLSRRQFDPSRSRWWCTPSPPPPLRGEAARRRWVRPALWICGRPPRAQYVGEFQCFFNPKKIWFTLKSIFGILGFCWWILRLFYRLTYTFLSFSNNVMQNLKNNQNTRSTIFVSELVCTLTRIEQSVGHWCEPHGMLCSIRVYVVPYDSLEICGDKYMMQCSAVWFVWNLWWEIYDAM